jgi:hypothetical protein
MVGLDTMTKAKQKAVPHARCACGATAAVQRRPFTASSPRPPPPPPPLLLLHLPPHDVRSRNSRGYKMRMLKEG